MTLCRSMRISRPALLILFLLISRCAVGQTFPDQGKDIHFPGINLGIGGGQDYGGAGFRMTVVASQKVEFFGAAGLNLLGIGLNGGAGLRLRPKSSVCPYAGAMYGYNAIIKISNQSDYNKTYYGPTFNLGSEFWIPKSTDFFNLEILVPVRSSKYSDDYDYLTKKLGYRLKKASPVVMSLGIHFTIRHS